jgi:hypothetical protein
MFFNMGGSILYLCARAYAALSGLPLRANTVSRDAIFLVLRPFAAPRLSYALRTASAINFLSRAETRNIHRYESRDRKAA